MLALLDGYDLTILVDAVSRGGAPGTLYTIEPDMGEIEGAHESGACENAHGLDPVKVLGPRRVRVRGWDAWLWSAASRRLWMMKPAASASPDRSRRP